MRHGAYISLVPVREAYHHKCACRREMVTYGSGKRTGQVQTQVFITTVLELPSKDMPPQTKGPPTRPTSQRLYITSNSATLGTKPLHMDLCRTLIQAIAVHGKKNEWGFGCLPCSLPKLYIFSQLSVFYLSQHSKVIQ